MYEMTESGAWVGASVFALMIPMAIVGPFAGPLADRLSRRKILLVCEAFSHYCGIECCSVVGRRT